MTKEHKCRHGKPSHNFIAASLSLSVVNTLPQPRKTFELDKLALLADDIVANGLLHPIVVARFTNVQCTEYLEAINSAWGTSHTIAELEREKGSRYYYILIAGERRFRAHLFLWEYGCVDCRGKDTVPGKCYGRIFGDDKIRATVCLNITPERAMRMQLAENTSVPVPFHEEAKAYILVYKYISRLYISLRKRFSLVRFAREVGRSEDYLRKSVKYCDLPEWIQIAVENGEIPGGVALELGRLLAAGFDEEITKREMLIAVAANMKVEEFRQRVNSLIEAKCSGQASFELMGEEISPNFRHLVSKEAVPYIRQFVVYFQRILPHFQSGDLGDPDSPFNEDTVTQQTGRFVEILTNLIPHLRKLRTEKRRAKKAVETTKSLLFDLSEEPPD